MATDCYRTLRSLSNAFDGYRLLPNFSIAIDCIRTCRIPSGRARCPNAPQRLVTSRPADSRRAKNPAAERFPEKPPAAFAKNRATPLRPSLHRSPAPSVSAEDRRLLLFVCGRRGMRIPSGLGKTVHNFNGRNYTIIAPVASSGKFSCRLRVFSCLFPPDLA